MLHQTQLHPAAPFTHEHFTMCPGNISQGSNPSGMLPLVSSLNLPSCGLQSLSFVTLPSTTKSLLQVSGDTELPVISRSTTLPYIYTAGTQPSVTSSPGSNSVDLGSFSTSSSSSYIPADLQACKLQEILSHITVLDATLPCHSSVAAKEYFH